MQKSAIINASTYAGGTGGAITVTAQQQLSINNDASIINTATATATGNAGTIILNGDNIILEQGGYVSSTTYSQGKGGDITINPNKQLTIDNNNTNASTGIFSNTESSGDAGIINVHSNGKVLIKNNGIIKSSTSSESEDKIIPASTGAAGLITVTANDIVLQNGIITNSTFGENKAGDITINTSHLTITDKGLINSESYATTPKGNAGNININSDNITVKNEGEIKVSTYGQGNAGDIKINAKQLSIYTDNTNSNIATGIYTTAHHESSGHAGNITVNSDKLSMDNATGISSSTFNNANAGNIVVQTKELILDKSSSIYSQAGSDIHTNPDDYSVNNKGNAGSVNVNSNNITLKNGGEISSATYNKGKAGIVNVKANNIDIYGSYLVDKQHTELSKISAFAKNTSSSGQTGNVNVTANKSIHLYDGGQITIQNDAKLIKENSIRSGILTVSAPDIILDSGAIITAAATTDYTEAGQLNINFAHQLTLNNSDITTHTKTGNGGNVVINGGESVNLHNATINTYTDNQSADVKGGNIKMTANILFMNNAEMLARGKNAINGGYADLTLNGVIPSNNQLQINGKTFGAFESAGTPLNIIRTANSGWTPLQLNLSGSMTSLNRNTLDLPDLNKGSCNDTAIVNSSLKRASKGGVSVNEMQFNFIPPATIKSSEKLSTVITPHLLVNNLIKTDYPCIAL